MVESVMGSNHASGEHSLTHPETVVSKENLFTSAKKSGSSSSLSSSSSSSSSLDNDFFQLDDAKLHLSNKCVTNLPTPAELDATQDVKGFLVERSSENGESYRRSSVSERIPSEAPPYSEESSSCSPGSQQIRNDSLSNSEHSNAVSPGSQQIHKDGRSYSGVSDLGSFRLQQNHNDGQSNSGESGSGSPRSDRVHEEVHSDSEESGPGSPGSASSPQSVENGLVMQSPPIQLMERPEDASSYRIPSSVFARSKSTTPAEWSIASNESLFSIHVGNNSFSRDYFLMGRSGELGKSGELIFPYKPDEYVFPNTPPSPIPGTDPEKKSSVSADDLGVDEAAAETMKEVLRTATEDKNKPKVQPVEVTRNSSSHRSDISGASNQSFAFPIKKRKKSCTWLFCNCSSCYGACCHCNLPSCSCCMCTRACFHWTWPSCSCSYCCRVCSHCRWPSCSCFSSCQTCSHCRWPSCSCFNSCQICSHGSSPFCGHCKWPSCSCPTCSQACCQCAWPSCFCSTFVRVCCRCKLPSWSCRNCSVGCCHCKRS